MTPEWKDATSYRQGERGKIEPRSWKMCIGEWRIWISCGHVYYPGEWIVTCRAIDISKHRLGMIADMSTQDARRLALVVVREKAMNLAKHIYDTAAQLPVEPAGDSK